MEKESGWDMNGDGKVDNMHDVSYDMIPVIVFNDGSRYLFEEYFTSRDFDGVANNMESFVERYERLLNRYFDFIY